MNDGDLEALITVCDPRFQLDMSDRVLNPAVYDGHEGIRRFYAEVTEVWESFTWEVVVDLHELDDLVVAVLHSSGKGRGSGVELDRRSAMIASRMIERFRSPSIATLRRRFRLPGATLNPSSDLVRSAPRLLLEGQDRDALHAILGARVDGAL